ncbi:cold-shock protein [Mesorhizobium sp. CN2-181]|uniref:cold-shock protein n=1 Tax=Mesorhizobium yinganensis TaxID=3157707 RepID=UPI0032B7378F
MGSRGNHRDRKRGFDSNAEPSFPDSAAEPSYFQRPARPNPAPAVDAEVLWFNPDKGFGFVRTVDGSEAFLHIRSLESAGHPSTTQGTRLKVILEDSPKGKQVCQVLEVAAAVDPPPRRPSTRSVANLPTQPTSADQTGEGTVKWYNPDKGFGFISLGEDKADVFVHASALTRAGMSPLTDGQRVNISYGQGSKGLETRTIRPA